MLIAFSFVNKVGKLSALICKDILAEYKLQRSSMSGNGKGRTDKDSAFVNVGLLELRLQSKIKELGALSKSIEKALEQKNSLSVLDKRRKPNRGKTATKKRGDRRLSLYKQYAK